MAYTEKGKKEMEAYVNAVATEGEHYNLGEMIHILERTGCVEDADRLKRGSNNGICKE